MDATLLPVLVHIQSSLDTDLSTPTLAQHARVSESTLHRQMVASTGETPRRHVERLRLERAASQLILHEATILEVALDNGFTSHEVFARAFRRHFGLAPSSWRSRRRAGDLGRHERRPGLTEAAEGVSLSSTRIVRMRPLEVAFMRHIGPYDEVDGSAWSRVRERLSELGHPADGLPVGICHDAPDITLPERLRFDAGWTIDRDLSGRCGLGQEAIAGGTYAVTTYVGPFALIGAAYQEIVARLMRHTDRIALGDGDFHGSIEWYRTGAIDEESYLNQVDISFPVTTRGNGPRALE